MSEKRIAIVTGASSGIGAATAMALARRGYTVVLSARRADKLEDVARQCRRVGGEAKALVTDVTREDQVEALVTGTAAEFGRLDVMVNNAGRGLFARVIETTDQEMRDIFDVNFHGLFYGSKAAAEVMARQRHGHIFNVSSVIGKRGTPFHAAYCATKFAIVGLSDSLRVEMKPYRVRVTTVCPALTDTEFFQQSHRGSAAKGTFQTVKGGLTPARVVGERIARAVGSNKPEIVITFGGKLLVLVSALCPRLVDWGMRKYHDALVRSLLTTSPEGRETGRP